MFASSIISENKESMEIENKDDLLYDQIQDKSEEYKQEISAIQNVIHSHSLFSSTTDLDKIIIECCNHLLNELVKEEKEFSSMDVELTGTRSFMLNLVSKNGLNLKFANEVLKKDRDLVMVAVNQNGYALEFADDSLKKDKEIVLCAIQAEKSYNKKSLQENINMATERTIQRG